MIRSDAKQGKREDVVRLPQGKPRKVSWNLLRCIFFSSCYPGPTTTLHLFKELHDSAQRSHMTIPKHQKLRIPFTLDQMSW